jgi:hypothetical protein
MLAFPPIQLGHAHTVFGIFEDPQRAKRESLAPDTSRACFLIMVLFKQECEMSKILASTDAFI